MLAVVKRKPERGIDIIDCPKPQIQADNQVMIEVSACGMCGTDLHIYEWATSIQNEVSLPRILGHEVSGTVREVGRSVKHFKQGDRVVTETWGGCGECYYCRRGFFNHCIYQTRIGQKADGGMTNYVVVPANSLFHIPPDLPFDEAAVIEPVCVALHGFERLRHFRPGDSVLILGPGPIGLLAGMIAGSAGAGRVIMMGLENDGRRLELAREFGMMTISIDADGAEEQLRDATEGRGADCVIDLSGGNDSLSRAVQFVRPAGEIVVIGLSVPDQFDPTALVIKEATIYGSWRRLPITWQRGIKLVANRTIDVRPLITHTFSVSKVEEAFDLLLCREGIKVIITPEKM